MFTKLAYFIPINEKNSPSVAKGYRNNVWKYHGIPEDVVSDRDGAFTGQYFTDLYTYLGIKRSLSTAFHPQTEGQTESINQVIEAYLTAYYNFEPNDWAEMFPMAMFAYNNSQQSSTKISPFYANYGHEPRINCPTGIQFRNPASELYCDDMTSIHTNLEGQLVDVPESMARYYYKKRKSIKKFQKGELVMLNGKNIG